MKIINILVSFLALALTTASIPIEAKSDAISKRDLSERSSMPGLEDLSELKKRHRVFANKQTVESKINSLRDNNFKHRQSIKYGNSERFSKYMDTVNKRKKMAKQRVSHLEKRALPRNHDFEDRLNFFKHHRNNQRENVKFNNKLKMADSRKSSRASRKFNHNL